MKFWNEIDGGTFFNQVFSKQIEIGNIELFAIKIDNSRPAIIVEFDIDELPDSPPEKWKKNKFNTCRIGLNCGSISNLSIKNIPTSEKLKMEVLLSGGTFIIRASNESSFVEFETKSPLLCGPSVYFKQ